MPVEMNRRGLFILLFIMLCAAGCGPSVDQSFRIAYLAFARPDYPYGTLVLTSRDAGGKWTQAKSAELGRDAVLLFPPPYPEGKISYLSIVGSGADKATSVWTWDAEGEAGTEYRAGLPRRAALLVANNAAVTTSAVVFIDAGHTELHSREFGRQIVGLKANARCSVAVVSTADPTDVRVLSDCMYARADWIGADVAYVTRSGYLVRHALDSAGAVDTLAREVEAFSVSAQTGGYAVSYRGDSIVVYDPSGNPRQEAVRGASVPMLSPDGAYLACHRDKQGLWLVDVETGDHREVGAGYPVNWSAGSDLLLFFERRMDERKVTHTIYHVAAAASGATTTLPEDGFIVDAVLVP